MIHFLVRVITRPLGPLSSDSGSAISAPRRPTDKRSTVPDRGPKNSGPIFFFVSQKSKMAAGRHLEFSTFRPLSPKRLEISSPKSTQKYFLGPRPPMPNHKSLSHFRSAILEPKPDVTWPGSSFHRTNFRKRLIPSYSPSKNLQNTEIKKGG